MKKTALIMAGGKGERFWPRSRVNLPKQFLSLTDDGKTMIQLTVERISPLVDIKDVYIATNANYKELVKQQLPGLPEENILCEPIGRNTAPCIALAAAVINRKYDDAVMLVLPSDHLIGYEELYLGTLKKAIATCMEGTNLVTIGITPTYPETGYGYINFSNETSDTSQDAYRVARFVEKPDIETAKDYLASGKYLWNSGMFVWKISSIKSNLKAFMPDIYEGAEKIGEAYALLCSMTCFAENLQHSEVSRLTSELWKKPTISIQFPAASAGTMWETGWQWNASTPPMNTATTSRAMSSRSAPNAAPFAAASV